MFQTTWYIQNIYQIKYDVSKCPLPLKKKKRSIFKPFQQNKQKLKLELEAILI